jgi:hypothetical protein
MAEKKKRLSGCVQTRAFSFEVRAEKDEKHGTYITGTPIVFDEISCLWLPTPEPGDIPLLEN